MMAASPGGPRQLATAFPRVPENEAFSADAQRISSSLWEHSSSWDPLRGTSRWGEVQLLGPLPSLGARLSEQGIGDSRRHGSSEALHLLQRAPESFYTSERLSVPRSLSAGSDVVTAYSSSQKRKPESAGAMCASRNITPPVFV